MKKINPNGNPLDRQIEVFATEFAKIPDFKKKMEDKDLNEVHSFVAISMVTMRSYTELVIQSFIPAVDRQIEETKRYIKSSKYKSVLSIINHDFNRIKFDTIRNGYVTLFHKYETFVKDLLKLYDRVLPAEGDSPESFERYCKRRFKFDAQEWYRYPSVHRVNFVSNCAKHWDGKCISRFAIPDIYSHLTTDDYINNTTKDLREDCAGLLESISLLAIIYGFCMQIRTFEESNNYDSVAYTSQEDIELFGEDYIKSMREMKMESIQWTQKMIDSAIPHLIRTIKFYEGDYHSPMPESDLNKLRAELGLLEV